MGRAFDRIVILMLENSTRANVLANPYMRALREKGVFLANSFGVTHPSQPNYILSIGGDTFGVVDDEPAKAVVGPSPATSIVDLLEAHGLTWKAYAENLGSYDKTSLDPGTPPFARKHVPFLSYPSITDNPERRAHIVDGSEFKTDLANGTLPHYSWYTPNLINDGHSISEKEGRYDQGDSNRHVNIDNIASFLSDFLSDDPIVKFPGGTLIYITFDEAYPYYDSYAIYSLMIGDMLPAGMHRSEPYNHYSQLASVEHNFGLGNLHRNDAAAHPWWFLKSCAGC
jgi:acid phosphatase